MLKSLYIKDYAIIDELNIEFNEGFTVFTGETGAGKSIIVGALSYLTKGKADTSVIRTGSDKTIIEGIFSIDSYMIPILKEADIDFDDELIIRRTISRDNHNTIKINQCSVTLAFLSDLFSEHIDIHSQKDSQYLLNKKNHLTLLDEYVNQYNLYDSYKTKYDEYTKALKELEKLENETYNETELEYITFDLNELNDANLSLDEELELEDKEKRYKSSEKYISSINTVLNLYDDDLGIREKLQMILKEINFDDTALAEIRNNIENIYYAFDDEITKIRKILMSFTYDDLNIDKIEERLFTYSRLKRKHNVDIYGLLQLKKELENKLAVYNDRDYIIAEKKKQLETLKMQANKFAKEIHDLRVSKAKELESQIVHHCNDLMLNNVDFLVKIDETELNSNGMDDVEFYISVNKGEELKPLKNVASGGEISRLMLALKTVFTSLSDTSLIIFDEIDTGVSGKTALAVGQKMADIALKTQVLTITHLAAVAACADNHYYIYKEDVDDNSRTFIKKLNREEIINELAIINSADNSATSLKAAEELYESAQESIR